MVVLPHLVLVHIQIAKPKVENSPPQSLTISLLILHKAGWCQSDLEFKTKSVAHNCHGMTDGPSLSWYESSFHTMKDEAVFVFHTMKAGSWDLI